MKCDSTDTIRVLECSNNVAIASWLLGAVINNDGKGRPDRYIPPDTTFCAANSEIETVWRRKDDLPPSSTYVPKWVPSNFKVEAEVKYFKQDVVWENADCFYMSITLACATRTQRSILYSHGVAEGRTLNVYIFSMLASSLSDTTGGTRGRIIQDSEQTNTN